MPQQSQLIEDLTNQLRAVRLQEEDFVARIAVEETRERRRLSTRSPEYITRGIFRVGDRVEILNPKTIIVAEHFGVITSVTLRFANILTDNGTRTKRIFRNIRRE